MTLHLEYVIKTNCSYLKKNTKSGNTVIEGSERPEERLKTLKLQSREEKKIAGPDQQEIRIDLEAA